MIEKSSNVNLKTFKTFCNASSIHGLGPLSAASNVPAKTFWILVVVAAISGLCYELYAVIDAYVSSPIATNIREGMIQILHHHVEYQRR